LAARPRLLLADEPTAALDSKTGREVVELLQRLAREQGCAVLMVTHDPRILDIADRLVRMEDGQLSEAEPMGLVTSG
jgi:putative ABC transport system ATP-binding protein